MLINHYLFDRLNQYLQVAILAEGETASALNPSL